MVAGNVAARSRKSPPPNEGLRQTQAMQRAAGGVAAEIKDGRRDLGPGEHCCMINFAVSGERD